jgi:hypothetical protein
MYLTILYNTSRDQIIKATDTIKAIVIQDLCFALPMKNINNFIDKTDALDFRIGATL